MQQGIKLSFALLVITEATQDGHDDASRVHDGGSVQIVHFKNVAQGTHQKGAPGCVHLCQITAR